MEKHIGGVILSHGELGAGLLAAAEIVVGELPFITAVSIGWHDDVETAKDEIARAIKQVSQGKGVLILTDMFGGTPTNIAAMFLDENVEILTGVNLPMVVRLGRQSEAATLNEVAQQVLQQGREEIYLAGELLSPLKTKRSEKLG
ncbi:MAG: PTS sugar transporter subunit IIA [Pyrinomonadaceae bacterium]